MRSGIVVGGRMGNPQICAVHLREKYRNEKKKASHGNFRKHHLQETFKFHYNPNAFSMNIERVCLHVDFRIFQFAPSLTLYCVIFALSRWRWE